MTRWARWLLPLLLLWLGAPEVSAQPGLPLVGYHYHFLRTNCFHVDDQVLDYAHWDWRGPVPLFVGGRSPKVFIQSYGPDRITLTSTQPGIIASKEVYVDGPGSFEFDLPITGRPDKPTQLLIRGRGEQVVGNLANLPSDTLKLLNGGMKGFPVVVYPPQTFVGVRVEPKRDFYRPGERVKFVAEFGSPLAKELPGGGFWVFVMPPEVIPEGRQSKLTAYYPGRQGGPEPEGPKKLSVLATLAMPEHPSLTDYGHRFLTLRFKVRAEPSGRHQTPCDLIEGPDERLVDILLEVPNAPLNQKVEPEKDVRRNVAPIQQKTAPIQRR